MEKATSVEMIKNLKFYLKNLINHFTRGLGKSRRNCRFSGAVKDICKDLQKTPVKHATCVILKQPLSLAVRLNLWW